MSVGAVRIETMTTTHTQLAGDVDTRTDELRLYLAGKIAKVDWRQEVMPGPPSESVCYDKTAWSVAEHLLGRDVHYTGPFFLSDDHGCTHGPGTHGRGHDCGSNGGDSRRDTVRLCLKAIDSSTGVFAWLDDPTAHGTLFEIGYAKGRGIPVIVGTPTADEAHVVRTHRSATREGRPEMWFALEGVDTHLAAPTPQAALAMAIEMFRHWRAVDNYGY